MSRICLCQPTEAIACHRLQTHYSEFEPTSRHSHLINNVHMCFAVKCVVVDMTRSEIEPTTFHTRSSEKFSTWPPRWSEPHGNVPFKQADTQVSYNLIIWWFRSYTSTLNVEIICPCIYMYVLFERTFWR